MSYIVQEISIYLLAAFLLGAIYGWVVRGIRSKQDVASHLQRHEDELKQLQQENRQLAERIEQLELTPASGAGDDWQDEYPLTVITDIESSTLAKLEAQQIQTTKQLWKHCATEDEVYALAANIGVEDFAIQRWVSIAHLLRVANIEVADAILLEATEIYSLQDLAVQKPTRLSEKLAKYNEREKILETLPDESKLAGWIEHAQHMVSMGNTS